ncbi:MAG TPA: hypothetical protein VFB62_09205 [Polyangiaceae bacterium]|jgi:hypothetical protein|nr:hypothetical protein [Polyangiaceae bacterium]
MSLLDRLSDLRERADTRPRLWLTVVAAILVAGGLARLVLDDRHVQVSLPESLEIEEMQWAQQDSNL